MSRYNFVFKFYYNARPMSFAAADLACGTLVPGAHIMVPRDSNDNSFVINLIRDRFISFSVITTQFYILFCRTSPTWLGLRYQSSSLLTMADAILPYGPSWYSGEPVSNVDGMCAAIQSNDWRWASKNCSMSFSSICSFCESFCVIISASVFIIIYFSHQHSSD